MRRLQHTNIVKYLGGQEEPSEGRLYIFTEFVAGGSVQGLIQSYGPLALPVVRRCARADRVGERVTASRGPRKVVFRRVVPCARAAGSGARAAHAAACASAPAPARAVAAPASALAPALMAGQW